MPHTPIVLMLSPADLDLVIDGLDAHMYWDLSDEVYRDNMTVQEPGSDDPEKLGMIVAIRALIRRFEKLRPRPPIDDDFTSAGGGNFGWKYRGKGYVHMEKDGNPTACGCAIIGNMGGTTEIAEEVLKADADKARITCPGCKHVFGIEPCGQHEVKPGD